jgi:threonine synthase
VRPELPDELADLYERSERLTRVSNDLGEVEALISRLCPV